MPTEADLFNAVENGFDRVTYQSDFFFWSLAALHAAAYVAVGAERVPPGSGATFAFILSLFAFSWTHTNARRRASSFIKAFLFALVSFVLPLIGGIVYFRFRPPTLVVTRLPSGTMVTLPIFEGPAWFFMRAPFRFLFKLGLWSTGAAFLVISLLDMLGAP
jgi:hypothetical protein